MATGNALILSIALIAFAAWMRAVTGTWLQPGSFFSLFWCFAGILPLVLAPQEPVGANAIFWLLAASFAVSAGGYIGNGGFKTRRLASPSQATEREVFVYGWILGLAIILGMGSNIAFMRGTNIGLGDVLDVQKLVVASNQAYFQRYIDGVESAPPAMSQALLPFVYLAPAVGGIFFVMTKKFKWQALGIIAFLPAVAVTILQTTKAAVLFAIVLWLSGYFAARLRFGSLKVFTKRHLLVAAVLASVLSVFFLAVSLARLASTDVSLINVVLAKLATAAFGHMTVFSQWLTDYWHQPYDPTLGAVTFAGPLDMLGFGHRIPGLFDSVIDLVAGDTSNIYTAFRPLIQDFTIPGALVILALLGFIGGMGFRMVAAGRWSGAPFLLISYVTIFWSPITWFWIYNSLTGTLVAVGLIVFLVRLWRSQRHTPIHGESFAGTT